MKQFLSGLEEAVSPTAGTFDGRNEINIFSGLEALDRRREIILSSVDSGINALEVTIDRFIDPVTALINDRPTVMFGSNNYLGLSMDRRCHAAALEATERYGFGTTASRLASGTTTIHREFEAKLAAHLNKEHCIIFPTGFMANIGAIAGLTSTGDAILIDADCHNSIFAACDQSRARKVKFQHNNIGDLRKKLENLSVPMEKTLVVTESVFSARGDQAPLKEIAALKREFGFYLMIDDAHSFGMYGENGTSLIQVEGISDDVDLHMVTFSKALGVIGGALLSNQQFFPCLKYSARPFMFSAALPPSTVASAMAGIDILQSDKPLRKQLWENIKHLRTKLTHSGFTINENPSPVVGAIVPNFLNGYELWTHLFENGYYANALLPPATPAGVHLLRFSPSACHKAEDIIGLGEVLKKFVWRK